MNRMNKTFPDGSAHRRYVVRGEGGQWLATVFIGADGVFSTVSDWGNYGYWWTSFGDDIRRFLCGCDDGYLLGKFSPQHEYDDVATEAAIREHIATLPEREREMETIHLEELESSGDFRGWCDETGIEAPWEFSRERTSRQAVAFVEKVMPRLREMLRAELAAEKAAA